MASTKDYGQHYRDIIDKEVMAFIADLQKTRIPKIFAGKFILKFVNQRIRHYGLNNKYLPNKTYEVTEQNDANPAGTETKTD